MGAKIARPIILREIPTKTSFKIDLKITQGHVYNFWNHTSFTQHILFTH